MALLATSPSRGCLERHITTKVREKPREGQVEPRTHEGGKSLRGSRTQEKKKRGKYITLRVPKQK
jgi:hypothetical protein